MQKLENTLCFDWLSFTVLCDSSNVDDTIEEVKELLGLDHVSWHTCPYCLQAYHYIHMIKYLDIFIMWGRAPGFESKSDLDTIFVSLSGNGCRTFENDSSKPEWNFLLTTLRSFPEIYHITRLDVAYDDVTGIIDIDSIADSVKYDRSNHLRLMSDHCVSLFRKATVEYDSDGGCCVWFGSRNSDCLFRFYDKYHERMSKLRQEDFEAADFPSHWIRFEMQLRDTLANNFISEYISTLNIYDPSSGDLGLVFKGVAYNYLRFVVPDPNDSNKSRWNMQPWYEAFLNDVEKISIASKKDRSTSISKAESYIHYQAINSLISIFITKGFSELLHFAYEKSKSYKGGLPPPKYLSAINDWLQSQDLPTISTVDEFLGVVDLELGKYKELPDLSNGVEF